mmetsp:Transcript_13706/g.21888  ORF Transcript_13706/g.21888 Transcript_13706/m.21888 type:complete len:204 (+) Transcript_13706:394-1005(+)
MASDVRVLRADDGNHRALRPCTRDQACCCTRVCHHHDGAALLRLGNHASCVDNRLTLRVDDVIRNWRKLQILLGDLACLTHMHHCLNWVLSFCSLSTKHNTISTIQHGICNIRDFGTRRSRMVNHALEHLCRYNDRFPSQTAFSDHPLLLHEHLRSIYLDPQVPSSNHNAVACFQNRVEIVASFLVLNLGDDYDTFWQELFYR